MITRRRILAVAAAVLPFAKRARSQEIAPAPPPAERWIELANTHTREIARVTYRNSGGFDREALAQLEWLLRDHRTGEQHAIDGALYDLLADLAARAGREPRFEIISGYRSPETNARLAARGGVSTRSLHMQGRAIDVRLAGFATAKLKTLALELRRGGVGYYPRSDFVHLDTGRVRRWEG